MKRIYLVGLAAVLLAVLPTAVTASTTYTESLAGIETGIPTPCGPAGSGDSLSPFAGVAFGTLNGTFTGSICHTPLPSATILPGGAFALMSKSTTVSGTFAGGTVMQVGPTGTFGIFCLQKYAVVGGLSPAGKFGATLMHYGLWDGKTCHVFFATVTGMAILSS
jgi:hypothetical protein